jgi:AcrR family transcriptional regulator/DNA-binding MarR family transcriptional regulator
MGLPPGKGGRVPMRRGVAGPRGGGVYLSRVQQTRLLDAAVAVVAEEGVKRLSATRVSGRAGMSTKTFYDLFADGEDCFLGVFDRAVEELAAALAPVWAGEGEWIERVRAALIVLLASVERDPALGKIVFVEALGAGPRVLARRAEVLDRVAQFIDEGREGSPLAGVLPSLTAAGVAGAAFSVIHARLVQRSSESLMELVNPVMATVVLPYQGRESSGRELARAVPELPDPVVRPGDDFAAHGGEGQAGQGRSERGVLGHASERGRRDAPPIVSVRLTERTCAVLAVVGERPGANSRQVAGGAGASEPQISRLLPRLAEHGLVENRGGGRGGFAKSWWLTARGVEFLGKGLVDAGPVAGRGSGVRGRSRSVGAGRRVGGGRRGVGGGVGAVESRRVRVLRAAAVAVDERGYGAVTVAHITARAKVSRRTFYELFVDRDECLLEVMRDIEQRVTAELRAAGLDGLVWRERIRMGLWTVLRFFDREPVLARFCLAQSARGDDSMAAYRGELLARVTGVIAAGAQESVEGQDCSPLVAEGIAGAVVSILNTRLSAFEGAGRRGHGDMPPLAVLLGELMALIVLPYLGSEVAREERFRPVPTAPARARLPVPAAGSKQGGKYLALDAGPSPVPGLRMTFRTALVLEAIARAPGISNLGVAHHAEINDQGQVSKLLSRLERNGLVQNTGRGQSKGAPNEWRLTPTGEKVERGIREGARNHEKQAA